MNITRNLVNSKSFRLISLVLAVMLLITLLTPVQCLASPTTAQVSAWYLLPDIKTNDWQARLDAQNKSTDGSWFGSAAVSAGNVIFTYT